MKYVAWFMVALVIVALIGVGYVYFTAQVVATEGRVLVIDALQQPTLFEQVKRDVANQSFKGTLLAKDPQIGEVEDYTFNTYQVTLKNSTFLLVDTIEVQIVPTETDVLQLGQEENISLAKQKSGSVQATLLTQKGTPATREVIVTYYLWGKSFTLRTIVEPQ